MPTYLDFETPLAELEGKIAELRTLAQGDKTVSIADEVKAWFDKADLRKTDALWHLVPAPIDAWEPLAFTPPAKASQAFHSGVNWDYKNI